MTNPTPRDSAQLPPLQVDALAQTLFAAWQKTPHSEDDGEYSFKTLGEMSSTYSDAWRSVAREALRAQAASVKPVFVVTVTKSGALVEMEPTTEAFNLPSGKYDLYAGAPPAHVPADAILFRDVDLSPEKQAEKFARENMARVRKVENGGHEFTTGDDDLDLLLGLTTDIADDNANMDTGVWWLQTLETVKARLAPQPQAVAASSPAHHMLARMAEVTAHLPDPWCEPVTAVDAPAQLPESMSRDEMLKYYSDYANLQSTEALRYQKRIRELEAALQASRQPQPQPQAQQGGGDADKKVRKAAIKAMGAWSGVMVGGTWDDAKGKEASAAEREFWLALDELATKGQRS